LTTVERVEPITFVVALIWAWVAVRRRDLFGMLASSVALLMPAAVIALAVLFPVGERYYFPSLLGWVLLAAMWAVEVDRRLATSLGRLAGITGLLGLLVSVGSSAYLYSRDGAGARLRWREAFAVIEAQREAGEAVLRHGEGLFQARYYYGHDVPGLGAGTDLASLAPGTWVIHRTRGSRPPMRPDVFEVRGRFEIPSKPWSWVLYVLRVRGPAPVVDAARHSE
jgi:hypothetical protein